MRWILHDWSDDESVGLLENVRKVVKPNARLMVVESVIPETPEFDMGKWMDVNMMVMATGGSVRPWNSATCSRGPTLRSRRSFPRLRRSASSWRNQHSAEGSHAPLDYPSTLPRSAGAGCIVARVFAGASRVARSNSRLSTPSSARAISRTSESPIRHQCVSRCDSCGGDNTRLPIRRRQGRSSAHRGAYPDNHRAGFARVAAFAEKAGRAKSKIAPPVAYCSRPAMPSALQSG